MEIALLLLAERRRVHRAVPSEFPSLTITLIIKQTSVGVIPESALSLRQPVPIVYDTSERELSRTRIIANAAATSSIAEDHRATFDSAFFFFFLAAPDKIPDLIPEAGNFNGNFY